MPTASTGYQTRRLTVVERSADVRRLVAAARRENETIALVPTMGALHAGHLSLIETARHDCDFLVVSVFVNPTQFGPSEDYRDYPRRFEDDLENCRKAGSDLVFHPDVEEMYPQDFATFVDIEGLSSIWEGACRPGHFRGVGTVVLKLFNIVQPDAAYFGRKDYQQQLLIRRMCRDLELPVEIRTCPTVREPDGLALSSRNSYLSPEQRQRALALSRSLRLARDRLIAGERDLALVRAAMTAEMERANVRVDYATIVHPETLVKLAAPLPEMMALVAARVDKIRLIDNMPIRLDPALYTL